MLDFKIVVEFLYLVLCVALVMVPQTIYFITDRKEHLVNAIVSYAIFIMLIIIQLL